MPQGRIVLKAICQSKKLAGLKTDGARLLFTWLIPNLDINGCYSGEADVVKGQVLTRLKKTTRVVESYLQDLDDVELIVRYSSNGDQFLCVPDFADKQPSLNPTKEAKPTIPLPTPEQLQSKSGETPRKVKESKVKERKVKNKYIEFVLLTDDEHKKLIDQFGTQGTQERIQNLNNYIGSKGKKYKSHYHTILTWERKNEKSNTSTGNKTKLFPIPGRTCSKQGCQMPAVYKTCSGHDWYYCTDHMPEKVKAKYA